jgi:hypothetical protein
MQLLQWINKNVVAVVALFAYLMMTLMLLGQARIIDNQRTLIRQLFSDSQELSARKIQEIKAAQHR